MVFADEEVMRYWDGEKVVIVAKEGSTVLLQCVNGNEIWTERHDEEDQQVVHWDWQAPGVPHDRADRLIDLYASGEGRLYGPLFIRQKMNITDRAFDLGDFSLRISSLEVADEGTYSCHLHHHYCGLHERRIFKVSVVEPEPEKKVVNHTRQNVPVVGRSQKQNGSHGGNTVAHHRSDCGSLLDPPTEDLWCKKFHYLLEDLSPTTSDRRFKKCSFLAFHFLFQLWPTCHTSFFMIPPPICPSHYAMK